MQYIKNLDPNTIKTIDAGHIKAFLESRGIPCDVMLNHGSGEVVVISDIDPGDILQDAVIPGKVDIASVLLSEVDKATTISGLKVILKRMITETNLV